MGRPLSFHSDSSEDEPSESDMEEEEDSKLEEEEYSDEYNNEDESYQKHYRPQTNKGYANSLKQRKPWHDKKSIAVYRFPRPTPKPLKEVFVYLRNNTILANTRVKNPKYVHLYSHPLLKISKSSAKSLKKVKSLKLLSLRDYGYRVEEPVEYYEKGVDFEEAKNGQLTGEDILYNELDYLLATTISLRKLYVMLCCANSRIFKRLQTYAKRQKDLKQFGFILGIDRKYPLNYRQAPEILQCDLLPLHSTLQKLEVRLESQPFIQIGGLSNLHRVTDFVCGTTCGRFPGEDSDFDDEFEEERDPDAICLGSSHIDLIGEMLECLNLKSVMITNFEMNFENDFWANLLAIFGGRPDVKLAYQGLVGSLMHAREIRDAIRDELADYPERRIKFMILTDNLLAETCFHGGGLRTLKFNFDKQYLHEIKKYETFKMIGGEEESESRFDDSDIFNDIAYIGYQVGYH